jgi:ferritin-like metal-binding protein YciE
MKQTIKPTVTSSTKKNANGTQQIKSVSTSPLEMFFLAQLKEMYYCEQHLIDAIPKMKAAATTEELEDAFEEHLSQTEKQLKRLDKIFRLIRKTPEGKQNQAIESLTRETEQVVGEIKDGTMTRDAALIICAQKIEHYEIATYGGLVQLALTMNLTQVAKLLEKTLQEEEQTDLQLTEIAEGFINFEAEKEGPFSWDDETAIAPYTAIM